MCRFLAWIGEPRFLDDFVLNADQSLVTQSRSALIGKTSLNADGFGLAWYGDREQPCVYKDVHPAWSDENLKQIASHTKARLFLAHIRASTSTAVSRNNCHPFSKGRWACATACSIAAMGARSNPKPTAIRNISKCWLGKPGTPRTCAFQHAGATGKKCMRLATLQIVSFQAYSIVFRKTALSFVRSRLMRMKPAGSRFYLGQQSLQMGERWKQ